MKYALLLFAALAFMLVVAQELAAQQPAPQPPHPNGDFTVTVVEGKLPATVNLRFINQDVVVLCRTRSTGQEIVATPSDATIKAVKDLVLDKNVKSPADGYYYTIYRFRAQKLGTCKLVLTSNGNFVASLEVTVKSDGHP